MFMAICSWMLLWYVQLAAIVWATVLTRWCPQQYGAHSTATDALRAGLPVLTQQGDQWPAYVAPFYGVVSFCLG